MLLYTFCLDGDVDVLLLDDGTGGLLDFDFSFFETFFIELLREMDGDFDMELSLDDFDGLFSGLFSGVFSIILLIDFSGELSFESLSLLLVLYLDNEAVVVPLL